MKNKLHFLLGFFILLQISSCKKENMGDCFKSTGKEKTETRSIFPFSRIELYDLIDVNFTYASSYSVEVIAGENLLEFIETSVKDSTLLIKNNNKCNWVRSYSNRITVNISSPRLRVLDYYSSGQCNFTNELRSGTLLVNLWEASGDLNLNFSGDYLELKSNTGTGTIKCKGNTRELVAYMGANGYIDASETTAEIVLAVNENTGKLIISATDVLNADIRGGGNIEYFGSPLVNLDATGSGKLIRK